MGIDSLEDPDEIFKPGVHLLQVIGPQRVRLGPMGSSAVLEHDLLEGTEQFTIR